jgi:SIR2-like domain
MIDTQVVFGMKTFWDDQPAGQANLLRLLTRESKWLAWENQEPNPDEGPTARRRTGCKDLVDEVLQAALHSTNVIVLLGSGASFCAKNDGAASAPGMGDLWDAVQSSIDTAKSEIGMSFEEVVRAVTGRAAADLNKNIEGLLSLCKIQLELLSVRASAEGATSDAKMRDTLIRFLTQAEQTILARVDFVTERTAVHAHMSLLQKFARRSGEKPRVRLFTTNYDLCIEQAALRQNIVLIDGFSHSARQRFNRDNFQHDIVRRTTVSTKAEYVDGVFHLYKLHGSIDWRRQPDNVVVRSTENTSTLRPVLIYPRSSKYQESFESPYLDMFSALQSCLREPDTTLIIAGYGFADDHISSPIWSALESNLSLRLILCDPALLDPKKLDSASLAGDSHLIDADIEGQRDYQKRIMKLVQQGDGRISVLNGRFEDLADAVPVISGESDRQRLQNRLERIRAEGAA